MANAFKTLFQESQTSLSQVPAFLKEAMKVRAEDNQKKLATVGAALLGLVASGRDAQVNALRAVRKQEKSLKENLASFERAAQYFEHTGNFGPLAKYIGSNQVHHFCQQLGVAVPDTDDQKVPDGWVPPTQTEQPA